MRLEFLENGPIRVEGKRFVVRVGEKEEALERPRVFLCRCGGSGNNPSATAPTSGSASRPRAGSWRWKATDPLVNPGRKG